MTDPSFSVDSGLLRALTLLSEPLSDALPLPSMLPESGLGESLVMEQLAPHVISGAARLDLPLSFAHMDPPTPWVTWAMALWNARLNQNLLHNETAPFGIDAEKLVVNWLAPFFGMNGGHFCSGSTIANLTALWAARDSAGIKTVVASESAHLSIKKAALILGLNYKSIPTGKTGKLDARALPSMEKACLVLTAGTTATGAIDSLDLGYQSAWAHVDAAWAGPLRLSSDYSYLLNGIELADSVAVSGHKWLFQPKDSAIVLFRDPHSVSKAISFEGGYLANANVGIQGSRGASAIPLLATLLAWGREGTAKRIEKCMHLAEVFASKLDGDKDFDLWGMPEAGVVVFRPESCSPQELISKLPPGMFSTCEINNREWLRSVAANPMADVERIFAVLVKGLRNDA